MYKLLALLLTLSFLAGLVLAADKPVSDDWIADHVKTALNQDAVVGAGGLDVDCKAGVVTINGKLPTQKQKDRAARVAHKVKGVKQVVNNITVAPSGK